MPEYTILVGDDISTSKTSILSNMHNYELMTATDKNITNG